MARAWIGGKPVALERAFAEAAGMLAASRCPLIAGLGTDIAGARAAISLAERIGGVVDHMNADTLLRDLTVLREAGMMLTTPNEARLRADTLLLVGSRLEKDAPELGQWLGLDPQEGTTSALPPPLAGEGGEGAATRTEQAASPSPALPRKRGRGRERSAPTSGQRAIVRLCPGRGAKVIQGETVVGRDADQLPTLLAALRARIADRPVGKTVVSTKAIADLATRLKAARFGVAVWSASDLDPLVIEMLCGLVADLNAHTRFTGFSIAPGDNAVGVLQACGWMTGFPMRTGFGRGYPEHDPWRFDGMRMVAGREADCVLWISGYRSAASSWADGPPVIALTAGDEVYPSAVQIEVGRPGVDHDSVEHYPPLGTLVAVEATRRNETISVADAIGRIASALPSACPGEVVTGSPKRTRAKSGVAR
jgi:formylmethanofuran dehydrogenase subunit B